ncbi:DUF4440 domain-containing protein [Acinetobacter sp. Marseille-Q1618]|uniref:DUF4440 domain-containing protein n=1 Tax=Acinetobacter sp. Marseille-Q1618 TaxID=2697502 RepID=UPI00156E9F57|nr:DUF4440 domain-containing protein [Acinetobacter sp. Marseille-Q1618]
MALNKEAAIQSTYTLHELIQAVFNAKGTDVQLAELIEYFTQDFEMVGAAGKRIQYEQVVQLFKNNQGNIPDLKIVISDAEIVMQKDDAILMNYTETHHKDAGVTSRRASVLLVEQDGKMYWRYLQETFLA